MFVVTDGDGRFRGMFVDEGIAVGSIYLTGADLEKVSVGNQKYTFKNPDGTLLTLQYEKVEPLQSIKQL